MGNWFVRIFREYVHAYVWHVVVTPPVAATILYIRGFQSSDAIWRVLQERPIIGVAVVLAALAVSKLLLLAYAYVRPKVVRHFEYGRIVRGCGIEHYFPRTQHVKTQEWARFVDLAEPKETDATQFPKETDNIRILCITGAATFARTAAPLHALLERYHGNIQILLVALDSGAFQQRIHEMAGAGWGDANELRTRFNVELNETRDFCTRLARKAPAALRSIQVRAYEVPVNFKMVFVGRYAWFQHYEPYDDVELSAGCILRNRSGGWYGALDCAFLNRWKISSEGDSRILLQRSEDNRWSGKWVSEACPGPGSPLVSSAPDIGPLSTVVLPQQAPPPAYPHL